MSQISVIVPVYKVEKYLNRCVDSILSQTFTDYELILVDDGSTDNCGAICDKYAEKDDRIVVIHKKNGGLSSARNAGIDWAFVNSDSEWLTFIDSDDWVHPKYLEALWQGAKKTDSDIVISSFESTDGESPMVYENMLTASIWKPERYYIEKNVNATVACGKLYRKECYKAIRFPVGKIHEDEFVTYRLLFAFDKVAVIDQPLYAYYQNSNGIMGSAWSTSRLVILDAITEQIEYFGRKKIKEVECFCKKRYVIAASASMKKIQEDRKLHFSAVKLIVKGKLVKALIQYRDEVPFIADNLWFYEAAFPIFMFLYWKIQRFH